MDIDRNESSIFHGYSLVLFRDILCRWMFIWFNEMNATQTYCDLYTHTASAYKFEPRFGFELHTHENWNHNVGVNLVQIQFWICLFFICQYCREKYTLFSKVRVFTIWNSLQKHSDDWREKQIQNDHYSNDLVSPSLKALKGCLDWYQNYKKNVEMKSRSARTGRELPITILCV